MNARPDPVLCVLCAALGARQFALVPQSLLRQLGRHLHGSATHLHRLACECGLAADALVLARGLAQATAGQSQSGALMSMRVHKLTTYLQAEDAFTLIEFLNQVREMLIQAYGDDIITMLQQASEPRPQEPGDLFGDEEQF